MKLLSLIGEPAPLGSLSLSCWWVTVRSLLLGELLSPMKAVLAAAISAEVDPAVGGEVAVLILERGKPARWFSQAACAN
jgi:hypothetical protein